MEHYIRIAQGFNRGREVFTRFLLVKKKVFTLDDESDIMAISQIVEALAHFEYAS